MLREQMIGFMTEELGRENINENSRYRMYFYSPKVEDSKRERRFNNKAEAEGRINIHKLDELDDLELFTAYNRFMRRYCTWM